MATVLSLPSIRASIKASLASSATSPSVKLAIAQSDELAVGVGSTAGKVDRCISVSFTVTSGTPFTLNVATAADPAGNTAAMVHVSAIMLQNLSTTPGQDMTMGGGTHPLTSDTDLCQANGGTTYKKNPNPGWTVTGSSADTITITVAAGTAVAGAITILGRSA